MFKYRDPEVVEKELYVLSFLSVALVILYLV
jgi:hypothetical protein